MHVVRTAIRSGRLMAVRQRRGRVLIPRASLEAWLDWVRDYRGETDDPTLISLREAAEVARCSKVVLTQSIRRGKLEGVKNQAGRLLLVRRSLESWLAALPPHYDDVEEKLLTIKEVAKLTGMTRSGVRQSVEKGYLPAIKLRRYGGSPAYYVTLPNFRAWVRQRQQLFGSETALQGEVLTLTEASHRYKIPRPFVREAVRKGELPSRRRGAGANSFKIVVGSIDLEQFLQARANRAVWDLARLARFVGFSRPTVRRWLKDRGLHGHKRPEGKGYRWELSSSELGAWLAENLPPYSAAVVGLPATLTYDQAVAITEHFAGCRAAFDSALSSGQLDSVVHADRILITRFAFDSWCLARGWPATGELGRDLSRHCELLTIKEASRRYQLKSWIIRRAISSGKLEGRRVKSPGGGVQYVFSAFEFERFLESRDASQGWTAKRLAAFTGFKQTTVLSWIRSRGLPAQRASQADGGLQWEFLPSKMGPWLREHLPPHAQKVAGMTSTLDLKEATALVQPHGKRSEIEQAIELGELDAIIWEDNVILTRFAFDAWCRAQAWSGSVKLPPQMWSLERLSRFLGYSRRTVNGWIKSRGLPARAGLRSNGGKRWEFHPAEIGPWLRTHLRPHSVLTLSEAHALVDELEDGGVKLETALELGELDALVTQDNVLITRYALDSWMP